MDKSLMVEVLRFGNSWMSNPLFQYTARGRYLFGYIVFFGLYILIFMVYLAPILYA